MYNIVYNNLINAKKINYNNKKIYIKFQKNK